MQSDIHTESKPGPRDVFEVLQIPSSELSDDDSAYASYDEQRSTVKAPNLMTNSFHTENAVSDSEEQTLLGHVDLGARDAQDHEVMTAALFTRDAYIAAGSETSFPQRGVLGSVLNMGDGPGCEGLGPKDSRMYVNTNTPFSAMVCGVQGSGKSHTVSVLLENMLIPQHNSIGKLVKPLSALVLHFGEGGELAQPSEAAWVSVAKALKNSSLRTPRIKVYVSKSALKTMTSVYSALGCHVEVEPLLFSQSELDVQAFLSMMAVNSSKAPPLYMASVMSILHSLGEDYTYRKFKSKLEEHKRMLNPAQLTGLTQRMALLESFLETKPTRIPSKRFAQGQLTVIDLSDPFLDPTQACGFFEIMTRLFVRADVGTGKVLVLDEAHKYLDSGTGFTNQLMTLIRMQRHLAMRVIISTQEPNIVPPILLDLCGVHILHRFSSPSWWEHVSKHVSTEMSNSEAFDRIVKLQTGQAIVFAPSGLGTFVNNTDVSSPRILGQFGRRWLLLKTRRRVTHDGGASILAVKGTHEFSN